MACCTSREKEKEEKPQKAASTLNESKSLADGIQKSMRNIEQVKNRFTNCKMFKDMVKSSFVAVDIDKSNTLDTNEVYIAVLHLYLKIGGICKGAVPPTHGDINKLIEKFDDPRKPGYLDYDHYLSFCQFLCSQIAGRVAVQMLLQMVIAPLLALLCTHQMEHLMQRLYPAKYKLFTSYVPMDVVVTLVVGIGISLLVPPLMALIDKYVLKEAKAFEMKSQQPKRKWWKPWSKMPPVP
jgi:hypothetical protein